MPTAKEVRAVAELRKLAKNWPKSLWIFAPGDYLYVLRTVNGERVYNADGGVDQSHIVDYVAVPSDGGEW